MRVICALMLTGLLTLPATATVTHSYGWEDGATILSWDGNLIEPTNVTGVQTGLTGDASPGTWSTTGPYSGARYLHVAEEPQSETPKAFIAWIKNLEMGDLVQARFRGWDSLDDAESADGFPGLRIWAHYAASDDIDDYQGEGGPGLDNSGYTEATGWHQCLSSWEYLINGNPYGGAGSLVIEARLYSHLPTSSAKTDYWIDQLQVTVPDYAEVIFAPEPTSLVLLTLGGLAMMRRIRR
ncbi:MAG: PEP-CTERM sorting domain-containing protein [Phycisphaerales bacterium]|nr:MAG: PEP-CTERM sorting domain-containing protein [Phycisphaerales bacterium]